MTEKKEVKREQVETAKQEETKEARVPQWLQDARENESLKRLASIALIAAGLLLCAGISVAVVIRRPLQEEQTPTPIPTVQAPASPEELIPPLTGEPVGESQPLEEVKFGQGNRLPFYQGRNAMGMLEPGVLIETGEASIHGQLPVTFTCRLPTLYIKQATEESNDEEDLQDFFAQPEEGKVVAFPELWPAAEAELKSCLSLFDNQAVYSQLQEVQGPAYQDDRGYQHNSWQEISFQGWIPLEQVVVVEKEEAEPTPMPTPQPTPPPEMGEPLNLQFSAGTFDTVAIQNGIRVRRWSLDEFEHELRQEGIIAAEAQLKAYSHWSGQRLQASLCAVSGAKKELIWIGGSLRYNGVWYYYDTGEWRQEP